MVQKAPKKRFPQEIRDDLAKSGLTEADATNMGWYSDPAGNLVIPYNNGTGFIRTRLTTPREIEKHGKITVRRYHQARGSKPELFLPKLGGIDWDAVKSDTSVRLLVTEGEKKAATACKAGLACIGMGGVDCASSKGGVPLPQWQEFDFADREVSIVFDSDITSKPQVAAAARRLANMLIQRGAKVCQVELPAKVDEKVGLDDFLVSAGLASSNSKKAKATFEALPTSMFTPTPTTDEIVEELNQTYAIVAINGQTMIQRERVAHDGMKDVEYLKLADFNLLLRNRYAISRDGREVKASVAWLEHPKRREFSRVVFEPGGAPSDEYNLWQGLSVEPAPGDCNLILRHIKEVICDGDQQVYDYLMAWCADMLQNPADRPGVAVVIRGEEGIGKGIFGQVLMRLTAPHSIQVTQGHQVIGRFNSILKARITVFLDEAFWAVDKGYEGPLKALITEPDLVIEYKGKEPIRIKNYARILMASNNDWAVPAGHGARRYLVMDASDKYKGDGTYFTPLVEHINNGGIEAFADFLMNFDLTKVDLRKPPKTKALLDQKLESLGSMDRFIFEMLMDGANGLVGRWEEAVSIDALYQRYTDAAKVVGAGWKEPKAKFGKQLMKILNLKRARPMVNLSRQYVWCFPTFAICRQRFEKYMEADDMPWPESDGVDRDSPQPRKPKKYE